MEDRKTFKLGLYLNDETIAERIFDAECYNPATRTNVNIKDIGREMMGSIRTVLSERNSNLNFIYGKDVYNLKHFPYNFNYPEVFLDAFKFGLYINNNTIIERVFSIRNFNRKAIFSTDIVDEIDYWVGAIQDHIKAKDIEYMWDDNLIMARFGYSSYDLKVMDPAKRAELVTKVQ
jgi:hypothetical protein